MAHMREPSHTAIGTWSGGRYLHFGEAIEVARLEALLRPGDGLDTLLTADAYGAGEADEGFPRFTDARLRAADAYGDYVRMATERSLERLGIDAFDVLLLHNPDRTGYTSEAVWEAMRAVRDEGLTAKLGVAPGPANGFTLDVIDCLERFGELIDWGMVILNPLEPWPGELCLAAAEQHDVKLITRVVDYGGLFWDDVRPGHAFPPRDHRTFRPQGWVEAGNEKLAGLRAIADRHGLTLMQLAVQYCLAQPAVACTVPTLIQEAGDDARPIEDKRAELLATPAEVVLDAAELAEIRAIGDNTGSMLLKGGAPDYSGEMRPDRWELDADLDAVAQRWGIEPERDLRQYTPARG
jgi:aryl-alcohol dehydrogenase-like predicted oxidoreductase